MNILEKVRFIESEAVPKDGAKCESLSTSIQITHACGCVLTQHFACGHTEHKGDDCPGDYNRRQAERAYFVQLCPEHEVLFRKQMQQKEFIELRCHCFRLIRETIEVDKNHADYMEILAALSSKVCALEDSVPVRDTFKGIIGYHTWLVEQRCFPGSFIEDTLHDLRECIRNHAEEWYAPRTSGYVKYY